jgi:hypothetical protein
MVVDGSLGTLDRPDEPSNLVSEPNSLLEWWRGPEIVL